LAILSQVPDIRGGEEPARWWRVYFTSPPGSGKPVSTETPEAALCRAIAGARKCFYGAFYAVSSERVINSLIAANSRGVDVRLVIENDNSRRPQTRRLADAGIPMVPDRNKRLMHNKFAVIDGETVWTGSYNLTENGALKDNNNAIEIRSTDLAKIYLDEFTEMFDKQVFGNRKEYGMFTALTQRYFVRIGDTPINAYFSPENDVERILLNRVRKARHSVHFMAYSFTSNPLGEEMIMLHRKGIIVKGVMEKSGSDSRDSEYVKMKIEGLPVKLDSNRHAMHHKVIIIDEETVITGSYNFSKNASRNNDENVLVIENRDIAAEYMKEFHRLYK
jgi:phosphatidylserine/phosphatidylglycerophosphate/cardiolipin synthase-like enzyme